MAGARRVRAAMTPLRSTRRWNRLLFFVACLLMCFSSITAWAGIEPWTPSEYRFGACSPNDTGLCLFMDLIMPALVLLDGLTYIMATAQEYQAIP